MRLDHPLLREQQGVYHRSQAAELGLRRSHTGAFPGSLVLPGVWSLLPPPLGASARVWAALLHAGPLARLTGFSAATVLGWRTPVVTEDVRVVVPHACKVASRDFVSVTRTRTGTTMTRLGIRIAGPEWVLADCALTLTGRDLTAVTAVALARREVTLPALATLVRMHPHVPGAMAVRGCITQLSGGAESVKEVDTLMAISQLGLPAPECQVSIYDEAGDLVAIADFYWEGVACFYDGSDHFTYAAQQADRRKRDRLEALGLQVPVITSGLLASRGLLKQRIEAGLAAATALASMRTGPPPWRAERRAGSGQPAD